MINLVDYDGLEFSVAMTKDLDDKLRAHLNKGPFQEDLTFALWRPSRGTRRLTAILCDAILPKDGERILDGNASFTSNYVLRALCAAAEGGYGKAGVAVIHSHLAPGWQALSLDDQKAEGVRLAGAVAGHTGLPLLGLTMGKDGTWSARFWLRSPLGTYQAEWVSSVRVIGRTLKIWFNPWGIPPPRPRASQVATISVWGEQKQADISRTHVGIVGVGSVGALVAESLSRMGVSQLTLIDPDRIEERNLDRTLGATRTDARLRTPKVSVSERILTKSHTAERFNVLTCQESILSHKGVSAALDCDVLFSCVDKPAPRHMLNTIAYAHLIPVVDGGILVEVDGERILHADWRIHTVGPGFPCMVCIGALSYESIQLDLEGKLDDPEYIKDVSGQFKPLVCRQNVFPFSMSVAAHEVLQFVGLLTGLQKIGGTGPQMYHCYPGEMEVLRVERCNEGCQYQALTASACDLTGNYKSR